MHWLVESATVKRFYRAFYLRPRYVLQMLMRIRNGNMLRNAVVGGLNVFGFATGTGRN